MKKIKSTTGETIKFRPDVRILSITPEGIVVDEATAEVVNSRLGNQITVEDTEEAATAEGAEVAPGAVVAEEKADAPLEETAPNADEEALPE